MSCYKRNYYPWTVNECLQLQREYELLELSIEEIAKRHNRTPLAIAYKIVAEEFDNVDKIDINKYHPLRTSSSIKSSVKTR